ncbi:DegT/DnrJ/EryC1/StrS family aminotransferase [Actinoalloteichus sp. AHMU CJ021]|uniref:dTDP-4-amino-4,6-dideoxygalactose transaminase n=1 Tax=Actinoalloteichus caeruleus DSM 43889 TaxID=1120930 RepID=A0ABT1JJX6_ACTCY|nr:DegT/DnrJ/EryC1/StrS family aminotransferase [Actinoalloteichus caeruleus]AUS78665.1 DegT/DnrJ/EryC1/StrS family aminotransferase [Actinoalloteichus sp. AHMU CJ021]MCP2332805.1 dTDP-4-amino-4,6-dideoxygalactose transaminase [Actinoalloteichus caeruleus DSM 43889]
MPDNIDDIALGQPTVGEPELAAIAEVFRSGWLAGAGPACARFEERFAAVAGTTHALATSNCGAALNLAMLVLDVRPGDEVVVADYTFPATAHAVAQAGATPVFADVRPDTLTLDAAAALAAVGPRTVGIVAVDVAGQPADYDALRAVADRHGLFLVEDAACAAGARYRGRPAGSLADLATFSFHGRKGITSGEGGALTSDRGDLVDRARTLHTYGVAPALTREGAVDLPIPSFTELGHNYRLSDVQAAIMGVQLDRLPALLDARRRVAERYQELLKDLDEITLPVTGADREHPWQAYLVTVDPSVSRDRLAFALRSAGVQTTIGTYACHLQPVYGSDRECPVSADLFRRQLALPMHANLTDEQVDRVASAVREGIAGLG